jgi:hypothetical protein
MHKVKEMLNDEYCDIQGMHGDLIFVGQCLMLIVSIDGADLLSANLLEMRVYAGKGALSHL